MTSHERASIAAGLRATTIVLIVTVPAFVLRTSTVTAQSVAGGLAVGLGLIVMEWTVRFQSRGAGPDAPKV
jgi:hypothetical protein